MKPLSKNTYFIIDFDSTFVTVESLEELAKITLKDKSGKEETLKEVSRITNLGMEGKISFNESLRKRLLLFQTDKNDIHKLIRLIKNHITKSVKNNRDFFKNYAEQIYVISGGFKEFITPVVKSYGITEKHVLANTFQFDNKGLVIGFDEKNPLSQDRGKIKAIEKLNLQGKIYIIGDGFTDYQIKKNGSAEKFFAFTENIKRQVVMDKADYVTASFDEILFKLKLPRALSYPKTMMKVLLLENIHSKAENILFSEGYKVETFNGSLSTEELWRVIPSVSILGIRSKTKIQKDILLHAKKLLSIGVFGIGTNNVDLSACSTSGISVFNAPFSNTRSVVELTIGNIIMLNRRVFDKSQKMHEGIWDKSALNCHEIRGKKLGIVGYGNIGSQLSVLAENLGMEVYYFDVTDKLALGNAKRCKTLEELLKISDIITIHVDGRKENINLIGSNEFSKMKDGVIFINCSRGLVVDVLPLVSFIKNGKIHGAAIDVFPNEPRSNNEKFTSFLQGLPNVILTPHIGAGTEEGQKNIAEFMSEKLISFVNTGNTANSVNFPNIQLPKLKKAHRFIHIHKNQPGVLSDLNKVFAQNKINIEGQYLKTNEEIGYVITDVYKNYSQSVIEELKNITNTIRFRILY